MKKLLVALLALAVVGGFVFADGAAAPALQITGGLKTGVMYRQTGSADGILSNYDYWNAGAVGSQWLDFNYDNGNYGFAAEIWNGDFTASADAIYAWTGAGAPVAGTDTIATVAPGALAPAWDQMEVYGKFFNGLTKLEVGMVGNNDYVTLGDKGTGWSGWNSSVAGFILNVYPVDGLKVAYYQPVTTAGGTLTNGFKAANFGFVYSMPKTFAIQGQFLNASATNPSANASISVSAIANVKLNAELFLNKLNDTTNGSTVIDQTVGYTMGNIYAGLVAYETMYAASGSKLVMSIKPKFNYTMDKVTYAGYAKYTMNTQFTTASGLDLGAYAKLADGPFTGYFGVDYNIADLSATSNAVLSVPLSVAVSF